MYNLTVQNICFEKNFGLIKKIYGEFIQRKKINYGYFIFLEKIKWKVDNFIDQSLIIKILIYRNYLNKNLQAL